MCSDGFRRSAIGVRLKPAGAATALVDSQGLSDAGRTFSVDDSEPLGGDGGCFTADGIRSNVTRIVGGTA